MKWYLVSLLVFGIWVDINQQLAADDAEDKNKFEKYNKCMTKSGISTWKVVAPVSNKTFYEIFNFQWNKHFPPVYPIAIFVPSCVSDVQATVKCGFKSKIQMVPSSGRHSYAGLSLGTNDSIIVDFRFMKSIEMNERERTVTIGPGAFVGHVNAVLWKNGGWGIPLGNCMTVAMGGHGIGGGIGYFSSLYGLLIDNILEIKMVDARGNAVTVNPSQETDLWWAMRGVGPGYIGLVTSFKVKMFNAKNIKLTTVRIQYKLKDFANVLANHFQWLDWVKQNEPTVSSIIFAVDDNYNVPGSSLWPGVDVQLLHIQDPKIQRNSSAAFLDAFSKFFPNATKVLIKNPSYIEFVIETSYTPVAIPSQPHQVSLKSSSTKTDELLDKLELFSTLTKEMAIPGYSFSKSFFVKKQFGVHCLKRVQKVVSAIPKNTIGIMITSEQGAIGIPLAEDSSYVHRNCILNVRAFFSSLNFEEVSPGNEWLKKFMETTTFMDSGGTYQNYPDIELKNYLSRYYGANLGKLIQIKRKWDPKGYFNSKMSIPLYYKPSTN